jgi:hypothetical protein
MTFSRRSWAPLGQFPVTSSYLLRHVIGCQVDHFFAILEQMAKRAYLGEMELMALLAVVRLGDEAYGVPISKELLNSAGRDIALGSIYAALDRIE